MCAVERHLDGALAQPPLDFGALLQVLPSIDPLVVADRLRGRAQDGNAAAAALLGSASTTCTALRASPRPIAHPLDYDWRFTADTTSSLIRRLQRATQDGGTIGYFGAPSAFVHAIEQLPDRRHVLFEPRTRWPIAASGSGRIIPIDLLRDPLPKLELDAALLDPPWYPEYHSAFLWCASSLLRTDALALTSFPPPTTRPSAGVEREQILRTADIASLVVERAEPLAIHYQTPPFERAAFAAAGVFAIPEAWRRGDLLVLRKQHGDVGRRPSPPTAKPEWAMFEVDEIPIAVRERNEPPAVIDKSLLEPAVVGATLPTVSRRDGSRADADLWSSRNRIYTSSAPIVLARVIGSLGAGGDYLAATEHRLGRRLTTREQDNVAITANRVRRLIRAEREEHGLV